MRTHNGRDAGQTSMLVLGLALVAFAVAGLAVDGTRAFLARRTLQNAADSAALAGAGELDETILYSSGGRRIGLDPSAARRVAAEWLTMRGLDARVDIVADPTRVEVTLRDRLSTTLLGLVGIGSISVGARGSAEPVPGPGAG